MNEMVTPQLTLTPIGVVHSPFTRRREAPRQSALCGDVHGTIELFPGHHFGEALTDIDTWSHIWVLFWFHENPNWRPMVQPPRGMKRRGVFATRSPHRPNPLGLSVVKLERRKRLTLEVSGLDILDESPVFDLKPYVPYTDRVEAANGGWPDLADAPTYRVEFTARARAHLAFLGELGDELRRELERVLVLGPVQPKYRRIKAVDDGYRIAIRDWRIFFGVAVDLVTVRYVASGYSDAHLVQNLSPELDVHRDFVSFTRNT